MTWIFIDHAGWLNLTPLVFLKPNTHIKSHTLKIKRLKMFSFNVHYSYNRTPFWQGSIQFIWCEERERESKYLLVKGSLLKFLSYHLHVRSIITLIVHKNKNINDTQLMQFILCQSMQSILPKNNDFSDEFSFSEQGSNCELKLKWSPCADRYPMLQY